MGLEGESADHLYQIDPACTQVALTLAQQERFVQRYLDALGPPVYGRGDPSTYEALEHAIQAKSRGDGRTDAASRSADYRSAAAYLTTLAQLIASGSRLTSHQTETITGYANSAAALLLQTGLS